MFSLRIFREFKASCMHFFAFSILQICVWKQTFSLGKDERYRLTLDWRFNALSQSEIRVYWWTHNSKNLTNLGRREFNSTPHQSSHSSWLLYQNKSTRARNPASNAGYQNISLQFTKPSKCSRKTQDFLNKRFQQICLKMPKNWLKQWICTAFWNTVNMIKMSLSSRVSKTPRKFTFKNFSFLLHPQNRIEVFSNSEESK